MRSQEVGFVKIGVIIAKITVMPEVFMTVKIIWGLFLILILIGTPAQSRCPGQMAITEVSFKTPLATKYNNGLDVKTINIPTDYVGGNNNSYILEKVEAEIEIEKSSGAITSLAVTGMTIVEVDVNYSRAETMIPRTDLPVKDFLIRDVTLYLYYMRSDETLWVVTRGANDDCSFDDHTDDAGLYYEIAPDQQVRTPTVTATPAAKIGNTLSPSQITIDVQSSPPANGQVTEA